MKKVLVALAVLAVMGGGVVFADNVFDDATDILKGRNEDISSSVYVAYTTKGDLPLIPAKIRVKLSTPLGANFTKEASFQAGLEF